MGSSEVNENYFPQKTEQKEETESYGEIIRRVCPDYLAMGMTLSEYYDGDPDDLISVRKAHELKQKQKNFDAWLNGLYVYHAMQCVSPLYRDWVRDHRPEKYLEQPFELYPEKKSDTQQAEDEKELRNQATIRAWVERVNRMKEGAQRG